jgi:hypothetical protein
MNSEYVRSDYHITARYSTAGEPAIRRDQSQITLIMKGQALSAAEENQMELNLTVAGLMVVLIDTNDTLSHLSCLGTRGLEK